MSATVSSWNPTAELGRRAHLRVVWVERGRPGCIDYRTGEIRLRRTDPPEVRSCVLTHELVHDERGPVPRWLRPREECVASPRAA